VLWIGGPPATGKTSIATRLARRHGLRWYNADTRTWLHRDRALREGNAAAQRWEAMSVEERWSAAPAELLKLWLHVERGPMVVDDVRALPESPVLVAEGSTVPPSVVSSGIAAPRQAVWLLPTPDFHRARLAGHPPGARTLYSAMAEQIERDVRESCAPTLTVDGSRSLHEVLATVEERFVATLSRGPHAETLAERRALLREANEAIVGQVHGYYARPWADGDPEAVLRTFLCECGDPGCDRDVETSVGAASTSPVMAAGHEV
jgi:hypothetical protein